MRSSEGDASIIRSVLISINSSLFEPKPVALSLGPRGRNGSKVSVLHARKIFISARHRRIGTLETEIDGLL